MATRVRDAVNRRLKELRYEPIEKRERALIGDEVVVDSTRTLLVWEPRRVVPSFAVPVEDVRGELVPAPAAGGPGAPPPLLHPGIGFGVHTTEGEALSLRLDGTTREGVASRPPTPTSPAT